MATKETQISSEQIFKGKIFQVYKDKVNVEKNNSESYREVVHHNGGGVGVLAITDDHKIILVKQFRYSTGKFLYEIPAGKLEKGEDPLTAGKRELEEEVNYTCKEMKKITGFYATPGYDDEYLHVYHAIGLSKLEGERNLDDDESIDIIYMDLDEAFDKVLKEEIIDGKTTIAILYAKALQL